MQAGSLGVWYGADKLEPAQWIDFVTTVERLGYDTQWYSEAMGFESMAFGSFLLANTQRLKIGSSIANIYARDAVASRNGLQTLGRVSNDRYVLGLGVSHVPLVERFRGHTYGKPLAAMRHYLRTDARRAARRRYVAGGYRGAGAAHAGTGCRTDPGGHSLQRDARAHRTGALDSRSRQMAGRGTEICLESDPAKALELARTELSRYMVLPNYYNNWRRLGFSESDLEDGGNARFLNAMVVWGRRGCHPCPRPRALRRRRHAGLPPTRPSPRRPRQRQSDAHRAGAIADATRYA